MHIAHPVTASRRLRRAFTLIELLVVILIIVILVTIVSIASFALFGKGKEGSSKVILEKAGGSIASRNTELGFLYSPSRLKSKVSDGFAAATGISTAKKWSDLKPEQRSKILAFLIAPTAEQWEKIDKTKSPYSAIIGEADSRDMLLKDDADGFNMLVDAWGKPIDYAFVEKGAMGASDSTPPFVIFSGGPDEDRAKVEDNLNWSTKEKGFKGKIE